MDDIIAAVNGAPSCDRAMKVAEACAYGASADVQFGAAVEKKCEGDFLADLKAPQKAGLCTRDGRLRPEIPEPVRHHVSLGYGFLPGEGRPALLAKGAEAGEPVKGSLARPPVPQAASAALAFSAIAWNAAGSAMARSDSTLRSTVMPDLARPLMKTL